MATIAEQIIEHLRVRPGRSAYEVAQAIRADKSSVASLCLRLVKAGRLRREAGEGPRKGFGYYINGD